MLYLIAAILGLCAGPLLFVLLHRAPKPQLALDGFVLVAVVGLVMLHVLPEAVEVASGWALIAAAVGLVLPLAAERVRALSHDVSHGLVLAVAFVGLMLHASLDGVGLAGSDGLGIAVVVHRIPVGLGVWWLVRPQFGRRWATLVLAALCGATVAGWSLQAALVAPAGVVWVQVVQALVAGSLLHVILHQAVGFHDHDHDSSGWRIYGALGAVLAGVLVAILPDPHHHALGGHIIELTLAASPFLLVGFAVLLLVRRHALLRTLDIAVPWTMALLLVASMVTHVHMETTVLQVICTTAFAVLVVVSLAHQGPREFVLVVLPLDLLRAHTHATHEHEHAHAATAETV